MFTKLKPVLLLILFILPSIFFFFKPGIYWNMHDDMQLVRQLQMEKCLTDGQIPCRWTPDLGYGYGYPLFNFYPPLPYYIGESFRLLGFSFISAIKLTAALQFLISGLGMYLLASKYFGPIGGLISALLYNYGPYHSVNIYVRGAMNEAWATAFFPYIFYFISQAIANNRLHNYLLASFSFALLLLSHNPMALIFSPFLGIWILYCLYQHKPNNIFSTLFKILATFISSVLLTAYFTLPAVLETKLVQIESMFQNYYSFSVHFVSFFQIFISNFWGDGPSVWGTADGMSFSIGYLHWGISLIILGLVIKNYFATKQISWLPLILYIISFVSLFFTHERSTFIWLLIPIIQKIQFPWRFLSVSNFLFSLLAGSIITLIPARNHLKLWLLTIIVALTAILYLPFFHPVTSGPINDDQKFSGRAWTNQVTGGIYDYLPKTASTAAKGPAQDFIDAINPTGTKYNLSGQKKGTDWLFFNIDVDSPATITLPILYFPNFKLLVNQKYTDTKYDPELGRITFDANPGHNQVYIYLEDTPIRRFANYISLFSITLFIYLFINATWIRPKSTK
jgi:hypothetical protein